MRRCILKVDDLEQWKGSQAYHAVLSLLDRVNGAVRGLRISEAPVTTVGEELLKMLQLIDQIVSKNPALPMQKSQRYGNPAFRAFYDQLQSATGRVLAGLLPEGGGEDELAIYVLGAFGNRVRIDYGTGHELSFIAFLAALEANRGIGDGPRGSFTEAELRSIGLAVLQRYLVLVRRIQRTYSLEPAGSHGVWGLDDHQFVPFIWGSAQLIGAEFAAPPLPPSAIMDARLVARQAPDYHYLAAIEYICSVKGPQLAEHSPLLYDISGLPEWERLNRGLLRMYRDEVLHKFPVVQHVEFGRLLPWEP